MKIFRRTGSLSGVLMLTALLGCSVYLPRGNASALNRPDLEKSLAGSPLSDEEKVLHVLNRLGFGPRPGDVTKLAVSGIPDYIARQLNPESIDDSALEARLKGLETIHMSSRELAEIVRREQEAQRARRSVEGKTGEPENRSPEETDPGREMRSARRADPDGVRKIAVELQQAKLLRATYGERQLQEVMTDFWFNHFNVFFGKGADRIFTTEYEREVIRPRALGNFHDLLLATARSPAMLFYLDNWMSVDPEARIPERFNRMRRRPEDTGAAPGQGAPAQARRPRGLNENYARELMELHTLGVDGGYTQKDVTEVARCFTGWTLRNPRQGGGFQFVPFLHDNGGKQVLGLTVPPGGGVRDGEMVLRMLADHPSTARFISEKLCRRFVSDNPPEALVKRCSEQFQRTQGDIRQVLATIFSSPEFYSREYYRAKTKKPFELVVSALRATGVETQAHPRILLMLRSMGEALYGCQPPTGYADTAAAWINTGALLERINFATALVSGRIPDTRIRWADFRPTGTEAATLVSVLARHLLGSSTEPAFVEAIEEQVKSMDSGSGPRARVVQVAGLILGSPEFQRR